MILGLSFYQIAWYFVIYSFIGWCLEVVYCTVTGGKIVNRGFLNGPVCPIYGFGMIAVLLLLKNIPMQKAGDLSVLSIFFGSMILATLVELIGGFLMFKIFHARWWDYSKRPYNLGGYICLQFSLAWGIGGVIVIRVIHPIVERLSVNKVPSSIGWYILLALYSLYAIDTILTIITIAGFNKRLRELDRVSKSIRKLSDTLSDGLGAGAIATDQQITKGKIQATLAKAEARDALTEAANSMQDRYYGAKASFGDASAEMTRRSEELKDRYQNLRQSLNHKGLFSVKRIVDAFPEINYPDYREVFDEFKDRMTKPKEN